MKFSEIFQGLVLSGVLCFSYAMAADTDVAISPALISKTASKAPFLGAAARGHKVVAVGEHGVIVVSDDGGEHFRQASYVPVSTTLTAVYMIDDQTGWAVGHQGAILKTTDGGDTWALQRSDLQEDRPLFDVHFFDEQNGLAIGLWSLVLKTSDGGVTWTPASLNTPEEFSSDVNLFSLFPDGNGGVYATAEQGLLLYSPDRGETWHYMTTGYEGSLWAGAKLQDKTLLVGGLRGNLMASHDEGATWERIAIPKTASITSISTFGHNVYVAGLDGLLLESRDGAASFADLEDAQGASLTRVLAIAPDHFILFSKGGVVTR